MVEIREARFDDKRNVRAIHCAEREDRRKGVVGHSAVFLHCVILVGVTTSAMEDAQTAYSDAQRP